MRNVLPIGFILGLSITQGIAQQTNVKSTTLNFQDTVGNQQKIHASDLKTKQTQNLKKIYFKFTLTAGAMNFRTTDFVLKTRFNYGYSIASAATNTFYDSLHVNAHRGLVPNGMIGFQIGSRTGLFLGMNTGAFGNGTIDGNLSNIEIGYNIKLPLKHFTLQPSIEYSAASVISYFSQTISTNGNDVNVLGNVYHYKVCTKPPTQDIRVGVQEKIKGLQLKMSINYDLNKYVAIRLSGGYWTQVSSSMLLYLNSKYKTATAHGEIYSDIKGNNDKPVKNAYNLNGPYLEATLLFTIPSSPHLNSGGSHYHHYHTHIGGFHHC
jgi:hypothetical protein